MAKALTRKNIVGQVFGRLTVESFSHTDGRRRAQWHCICECGNKCVIPGISLRSKHTMSCGCLLAENLKYGSFSHGYTNTPVWKAWRAMRHRCRSMKIDRSKNYAGRGIKCCERWNSFENFLQDMGEPPNGYTIERIDVNGNYEPSNCKWISADAQYSNKTTTLFVYFHGEKYSFRDLVRASGLKHMTAYARYRTYGWTAERTFSNVEPSSVIHLAFDQTPTTASS